MPQFNLLPHQQRAVDFCIQRDGKLGLFQDMRTGKTREVLAYLHDRSDRILILAPLWVTGVWVREMEEVEYDYQVELLTGLTIKARAARLKAGGSDRMVVIVNWEAAWREPLRGQLVKWLKGSDRSAVVAEESHKIKSRQAKSSKFAHLLATIPEVRFRLALTGTPTGNGLEDLWSQYRFIDSSVFGTRWSDFERDYIVRGGYLGYQIASYRNVDLIQRKVAATAFQISRADALGAEEYLDTAVPVMLNASTVSTYNQLKKDAITQLNGKGPDGFPLHGIALARSALTSLLRLQQITGGCVGTDEGIKDISSEKLDICEQITRDAWEQGRSVVIFCRFRRDIERVAQRLGLPPHAMLMGGLPMAARERALDELRSGELKAVVAQITLASLGVDMASARTAIFYSTGFSLVDFSQARARLFGPRQTASVDIFHLLASTPKNTVDHKVYSALTHKQDIAKQVVDLGYVRRVFE